MRLDSEKSYCVRYKNIPGSFICFISDPEIEVREICSICLAQGVVWYVHSDSESHQGSEHFKQWEVTPEFLEEWAESMRSKDKLRGER